MFENMNPSGLAKRCIMFENMKRPILHRMDPSRLMAGRIFTLGRRSCLSEVAHG
ncbi:MAG TPA: hypothetical protein VK450_06070 [Methanomicrobiales archaeon]|nr:hypothetical protein [Methanomicrobiales archaeon]